MAASRSPALALSSMRTQAASRCRMGSSGSGMPMAHLHPRPIRNSGLMSCQLGRQGATARQPRRVALHVLERDGLLAEESRVVLLADEKVIAQGIDQRDQHLRELRL